MKNLTFCILLFSIPNFFYSQNIYVKPGGTGNGNSWETATNDLSTALFLSQKGGQIWVAAGEYFPTSTTDRLASFQLPDGVQLYGGFIGHETSLDQRNWTINKTILNGNIGTPSSYDNSYSVIITNNVSEKTVLDGFIITNGYADSNHSTVEKINCGGGWYNNGTGAGNRSNPTIRNCNFINNYAKNGAGLYNNGRAGNASPTLINCKFSGNHSDLNGGAVFNDGQHNGQCNPIFTNCIFINNFGDFGGAILNYCLGELSISEFINCQFQENIAYKKGGAIFYINTDAIVNSNFKHCQFSDNFPKNIETISTSSKEHSFLHKKRAKKKLKQAPSFQ